MGVLMISIYIWSVGWPVAPQDSVHPIGNNYGQFLDINGPFMHNGIDVLDTAGAPILAVADGFVKAWLTTSGPLNWHLATGDEYGTDSCDGWLYGHVDPNRFHLNIGDTCSVGELIGYIVPFPSNFHHVHLSRIRSAGYPWTTCKFIENPLDVVVPNTDTVKPVFENAIGSDLFAFCRDNTSEYLDPDSLIGDVDIIARIYDKTGETTVVEIWEHIAPYSIEYRMYGPETIPTMRTMVFNGFLNDSMQYALTLYKDDSVCNSEGDKVLYKADFYFILTNTDGDSLIELSDSAGYWQTTTYSDGVYWVVVTAYDAYGNSQSDSMQVTLKNGIGIQEKPIIREVKDYIPTIFYGALNLPKDKTWKLYDISGRAVAVNNLKPGIYFIEVEGRISQKVVKIK